MPNLVSLAVTPAGVLIPEGDTQQFKAVGTYNNGSTEDLTASVTWTSSDGTIATINASGLASAVAPGTVTIQATSGAIVGTANALVEAGLVSITVLPADASLSIGQTQQFLAAGSYSDSHTEGLTGEVIWTSSAPTVVSITPAGLATALAAGSATIQAAAGSIAGTAAASVGQHSQDLLKQMGPVAVETPQLGRVEFPRPSEMITAVNYLEMKEKEAAGTPAAGVITIGYNRGLGPSKEFSQ